MKSVKKMCKEMSFTVEGGYKPSKIDDIHQHLQEVRRGTGRVKPKKGKGSFKRRPKYRKDYY